ncbi:hypothetical protein BJX64DRAFT_36520 [Aspergillus heterothallicus]
MVDNYGSIFLSAIEGGYSGIISRCIEYGGIWSGKDDHGWNADLMTCHRQNKSLLAMIRKTIGRKPAAPLPPSAWEVSQSRTVGYTGDTLTIEGGV